MRKRFFYAAGFVVLVSALGLGWLYSQVPKRVEGAYFDSAGVRIHYTDQGAGEPVILVHGFSVHQDINWRQPGIIDRLAQQYRVVALDLRGHGLSGKPHDPALYGEEMARDVIRLMDHLQIPKAQVVGYSMGGFITLKLMALAPERLVSAAPCGMGWQVATVENTAPLLQLAEDLEAGKGFGVLFKAIYPPGKAPSGAEQSAIDFAISAFNDKKALAASMRAFEGLAISEAELRACSMPVLTIVGADDPLITGTDQMDVLMPNHKTVVIDGTDHVTTLRDTRFADAVEQFLGAHRTAQVAAPVRPEAA
jgi:pimeloyl-ACP methyl ester carboxylesterase